LFFCCFFFGDEIWCSGGGFTCCCGSTTISRFFAAAESTASSNEYSTLIIEEWFSIFFVNGCYAGFYNGGVALVDYFEEFWVGDKSAGCGDGIGEDLEVLFAVEKHHGAEVGDEVGDVVGCFGREEGDYAVGWEDLEVFISFTVGAFMSVNPSSFGYD